MASFNQSSDTALNLNYVNKIANYVTQKNPLSADSGKELITRCTKLMLDVANGTLTQIQRELLTENIHILHNKANFAVLWSSGPDGEKKSKNKLQAIFASCLNMLKPFVPEVVANHQAYHGDVLFEAFKNTHLVFAHPRDVVRAYTKTLLLQVCERSGRSCYLLRNSSTVTNSSSKSRVVLSSIEIEYGSAVYHHRLITYSGEKWILSSEKGLYFDSLEKILLHVLPFLSTPALPPSKEEVTCFLLSHSQGKEFSFASTVNLSILSWGQMWDDYQKNDKKTSCDKH